MYSPDDVLNKKTNEIIDFAIQNKDQTDQFRLNHFSANSANTWVYFQYWESFRLDPRNVAHYTNPLVFELVSNESYGIIAMDFAFPETVDYYIKL